MSAETASDATDEPWPQRVLDSIWLLALAAVLYWVLSYIVWGIVDILTVPTG
ncbi:MAG: hypothetical protein ABEJ90_01210 [Halobacterium sp.]